MNISAVKILIKWKWLDNSTKASSLPVSMMICSSLINMLPMRNTILKDYRRMAVSRHRPSFGISSFFLLQRFFDRPKPLSLGAVQEAVLENSLHVIAKNGFHVRFDADGIFILYSLFFYSYFTILHWDIRGGEWMKWRRVVRLVSALSLFLFARRKCLFHPFSLHVNEDRGGGLCVCLLPVMRDGMWQCLFGMESDCVVWSTVTGALRRDYMGYGIALFGYGTVLSI